MADVADVAAWAARTIGRDHGCIRDGANRETREPCPHCARYGAALAAAWEDPDRPL